MVWWNGRVGGVAPMAEVRVGAREGVRLRPEVVSGAQGCAIVVLRIGRVDAGADGGLGALE